MHISESVESACGKSAFPLDKSPLSKSADDTIVFERVHAILAKIDRRERRVELWGEESKTGYNTKNRRILLSWMRDFCSDHSLSSESFHLSVCLLDRFVSGVGGAYVDRHNLQLAGVAALLVSTKSVVSVESGVDVQERIHLTARRVLELCGERVDVGEIREVNRLERVLLESLEWEVECSTCVRGVSEVLECMSKLVVDASGVLRACCALCDQLVLEDAFYKYRLRDICVSVFECVSGVSLRGERVDICCRVWVLDKYELYNKK